MRTLQATHIVLPCSPYVHGEITVNQRILRRQEVESVTGLSRSSIYKAMSAGDFPAPIQLSKRAVGWRQSDVEKWIRSRSVAPAGRVTE